MTAAWRPDILGPGWVARDLLLPDGAVATLVRADRPPSNRPAVLAVHGYVDYFYQRHLAAAFDAAGYSFYALDLRGYGRSIGRGSGAPGLGSDDPNFITTLAAYAHDLDAACAAIRAEGHRDIILLGHSTGGLIASLWANARPGALRALILNSPWFDLNASWFERVVVTRIVDVLGLIAPRLRLRAGLNPHWGRALHVSTGGEWDYNLAWKPLHGFPVRAGWLRTIRRGHAAIARGLTIDCPVLVLSSDRTGPPDRWHPELLTSDSILNVEHIQGRATALGPLVDQVRIPGGAHDLAVSAGSAREHYLRTVLTWLSETAPVASESR